MDRTPARELDVDMAEGVKKRRKMVLVVLKKGGDELRFEHTE